MDSFGTIWPACLIGSGGLAALLRGLSRLRGTTLAAACGWAIVAWIAAVGSVLLVESRVVDPGAAAPLQWSAGMAMLCPTVALLGAKRPQHGAWQWIVLATWAVLSVPAAQAWLFGGGEALRVHPAWQAPVLVLILIGPVNYLPTRRLPTALATAVGQMLWLGPWLTPGIADIPAGVRVSWSMVLVASGPILAALEVPRARPLSPGPGRLWRDFRNLYGVLWTLRVAERVNQQARATGSEVELTWRGVAARGATEYLDEFPDQIVCPLLAILPRFVSSAWMNRRLEGSPPGV